MSMKLRRPFVIAMLLIAALANPTRAALFDHSSYDAVLRHYVDDDGSVDYASIQEASLTALEGYFERLADADMAGWTKPERLAFWINAYNARVIYEVAQKPDLNKISDDFALFDKPFKIGGRRLTLHDIEQRILRGAVNKANGKGPIPGVSFDRADPLIHFALNAGAAGSPKLRPFAYTAENIEAAMQENAVKFINSSDGMSVADDHLQLSSLFKWYAGDFKSAGGVPAYLSLLLVPDSAGDASARKRLLATAYKKSTYRFDWKLNGKKYQSPPVDGLAPAQEEIPPDALTTSNPDLGATK